MPSICVGEGRVWIFQPEAVEPRAGGLEGVLLLPGEIEWEDLTVRQSA